MVIASQAEQDIASREKNAEQLQDELAAQDESITKLSKEKKALEEAKQVRHSVITSVSFTQIRTNSAKFEKIWKSNGSFFLKRKRNAKKVI